jgi:aspartate kinase
VARKVIRTKGAGNRVVVILLAMAGETDRLIGLALKATETMDGREYDALNSTGEQVTVALLAMMHNGMGHRAKRNLRSRSCTTRLVWRHKNKWGSVKGKGLAN